MTSPAKEKGWDKDHWEYRCSCPRKDGQPECGGFDSFWKTVVTSPQWKAWEVQVARNFSSVSRMDNWPSRKKKMMSLPIFDVDECVACGWISQAHFQAFLKFCKKYKGPTESKK